MLFKKNSMSRVYHIITQPIDLFVMIIRLKDRKEEKETKIMNEMPHIRTVLFCKRG